MIWNISAICAAMRSIMNTTNIEATTAEFAAIPTPCVPFFVVYPLKHPTMPIAKPKNTDFTIDGTTSPNVSFSKTSNPKYAQPNPSSNAGVFCCRIAIA